MLDTMPLTLGTSKLGERPDASALADALLVSSLGNLDTSNAYAGGRSEQSIGDAIARAGGLPRGKLVYSKADSGQDGTFDGARVRASIEESLTRLGLTSLPIYHLHDPYTISLHEAFAPGGAVPALLALRDEGVIGAVGIAAGTTQLVLDYVVTGAFDAVLSHNRFTLVDRTARPIFAAARERGMTVFNAAPFGGGVLADPSKTTYGYRPFSVEVERFLASLRGLAQSFDVDLAAAALHFSLRSDLVDSTVVGVTSTGRLEELETLMVSSVPDEFFDAVEALGNPPATGND